MMIEVDESDQGTEAGELIYNPIAQKADNTGILADCIHSLK